MNHYAIKVAGTQIFNIITNKMFMGQTSTETWEVLKKTHNYVGVLIFWAAYMEAKWMVAMVVAYFRVPVASWRNLGFKSAL